MSRNLRTESELPGEPEPLAGSALAFKLVCVGLVLALLALAWIAQAALGHRERRERAARAAARETIELRDRLGEPKDDDQGLVGPAGR